MSIKTLIIATAALAASTAMTVPSFAAGGDGTGPAGNPPPAADQQQPPVRASIMFNLLDTNHDGSVDKDEFAAISNATFAALDTNNDGKLTTDELRGRFGGMFGQRGGPGGPGGPGDRGPGMRWHDHDGRGGWGQGRMDDRPGPRGGMGRMAFNDGPGNGGQQGPQGGRPTFADLDTNHDGVISQDEFQAHQPLPGQGRGFGPRR